ncbi:MAG TPA: hypothetical protein VGS59_08910 [Candidatus Acidoferrales bacterium]|nr:hypothetical protein [Candidatus Acidoferrales bacterium]
MRVEVLYIAECSSYLAAMKLVREVLAAENVSAEVYEVLVEDEKMAAALRFCGSPTIRINGRDVADEPLGDRAFALSCRLYPGSKQIGVPSADVIHRALREARAGDRQ